jgi:hypothetical protein
MEIFADVFASFGLSASAGLNAYVPLLLVALIGRFTDWITLAEPWGAMTSWWVIGALVVLGTVEFFADKVPAVNHVNDLIQTLIRPTAGAVLFAASSDVISQIHPVVALIAGMLVAGGVHAAKSAAVRPAITATTGGAGNVPASIAEDFIATILTILSIVVPILVAGLVIVVVSYVVWLLWRRANRIRAA